MTLERANARKGRPMRVLRRTVYLVALTAALSASVTACSSSASSGASGASGASASGSSQQVAAASRQVSFAVSGTTTYGTLDVPAHRAGSRLAAALLLAGSGPTDRNGDDAAANLEPHTLQLIAGVLAKMGIISLRFDKYFSGQTGGGTFAGDPSSITLADYISQADTAYAFLGRQPAVNTGKLLVVGHSEGGMYALLVAESVSPRPAGLALIEPQDERLLSLIQLQTDEQIDAAVSQGTFTAAAGRQNAAGVQQAIAAFRAGQPVSTSGLAAGVVQLIAPELLSTANARYVRSDDAVYPPSVAAKLPHATRILVTDGTTDTNVPLSTIKPLVSALSGTSGPGLRVLTGVDHLLHGPGVAENDQVLAASAVTALQAWAQPYAL
jgi:pimeloyl-ACP methyl ester carboxylesterase